MNIVYSILKRAAVICCAVAAMMLVASCAKKIEEKPKYLWICGEANFKRFTCKDSVTFYLEKAKATGFNAVVVDVKPLYANTLYKSDFLPPLTSHDGVEIVRDWDYLQTFIDEAHRLGMKITASACVLPVGSPYWHKGIVYEDSVWNGRTCLERLPDGTMMDIRDDSTKVGAFLNPAIEENCEFAKRVIAEIVTKYDIDGIALDYCRFPDGNSDFSEATRVAFEEYLGEHIDNYPEDIFTFDENGDKVPGKYCKQWWAWRAQLISNLVKSIAEEVHAIKPNVLVEYWAASWILGLHETGQNWASPNSDYCLSQDWGSEEYKATGFAPYLDHFQLGAYLPHVWGPDDDESIEFAINRANDLIGDDCKMLGTIYAANHHEEFADAVYLCVSRTAGLMVFDLIQVEGFNLWGKIKEGIDRAEKEATEAK